MSQPLNDPSTRISMGMVYEEFRSFISLERGALHTSLQLLLRPGATIRSYLKGSRRKLTNPIRFLAMATALVTLAYVTCMPRSAVVSDIERGMEAAGEIPGEEPTEKTQEIMQLLAEVEAEAENPFQSWKFREARRRVSENLQERVGEISLTWMNVFLLFALPVNTLLSWLVFRKANYNFAEHIVVNAYILGFQNFLAIALLPPTILHSVPIWTFAYMLLSFAYQFVAWRQTFEARGVLWSLIILGLVLFSMLLYVTMQGAVTLSILWFSR